MSQILKHTSLDTQLRLSPISRSHEKAQELVNFLRNYGEKRVHSRLIDERRTISPHQVLDFARQGLFGLQTEQKYGGLELTYSDTFRVLQQASAVDPNLMLLLAVHYAIGTPPIQRFASSLQKSEILPQLSSGQALATIACSEPGAGANIRGITTKAIKQKDGRYILNGEKSWISLGSWAEYVTVMAQLEDEDGKQLGLTAFLVRQGTAGFEPGPEAMTLGVRGVPQNRIFLKDVELPSTALLGKEGQGGEIAQASFMLGRCIVAVGSIGAMKRCLQVVFRYARRRQIATGTLADNGLIHNQLQKMVQSVHSLEVLVQLLATQLDSGKAPATEIMIAAKILSSELMWKTIDQSVQMLGARGFMDTNIVGKYFRDMRLLRIFEGPTESMTSYLGMTIAKNPISFDSLLRRTLNAPEIADRFSHLAKDLHSHMSILKGTHKIETQRKELLVTQLGEAATWAILFAVQTDVKGQKFAIEHFEKSAREIMAEAARPVESDSLFQLQTEIEKFKEAIGDIEQQMAAEETELEFFVRREC